ncbi:MAG: fimbrial biogenesis chaperone [Burkholderiaceae bacterium]
MNAPKLPNLATLAAGLFLSFAAPALAGVFSVTPVRIYMTPKNRAVAVTLTNEGDTEVALQADLNAWSQRPDGTDELVLTEDMILSPPIIKLAPKARQVVRLALLKPADASRQLTYRMIVREVPEATAPKAAGMEVPIALALSMPVFITPPIAQREVRCEAARPDTQTLQALCSNSGTAYAQIREIQLKRGEQTLARFEGGNYILPGARKAIALKAEPAVAAGAAQLNVVFDDGKSQVFQVTLP